MKFYKKLPLDNHAPTSNRLSLLVDGRLVTDSTNSYELPRGSKLERPAQIVNGQIRYSTTLKEIEARVNDVWEKVRTVRPATLAVQNLGIGNLQVSTFGPLNSEYKPSYAAGDANVMVYVDNVYQIPGVNYTLGGASTVTNRTAQTALAGTNTLFLSSLTNVVIGQKVGGSPSIPVAASVYSITTAANAVVLTLSITGNITSGTAVTFAFSSGTYINFNGTVPYKPVYAVLGMDGYFPPDVNYSPSVI
jgi:hypothetical protein